MAHVTQVRHIGIVVKDLDRSLKFYQELLGLEVQRRMMESGECLENVLILEHVEVETVKLGATNGLTQIELLSFKSHEVSIHENIRSLMTGPTHVAFTVDNLDNLYAELREVGIEFNCPPQKSADGKALLTFCKDPDGTLIELVEIL
jgi:catechol 2,3-dioxygenase-like lactoylglutathione lyase family enzyme